MITVSKKARLSLQALIFGAALLTGVSAFGMERERKQPGCFAVFTQSLKNKMKRLISKQVSPTNLTSKNVEAIGSQNVHPLPYTVSPRASSDYSYSSSDSSSYARDPRDIGNGY